MQESIVSTLPVGFAKDFKPELRLISQLLRFAQEEGRGDKEAISKATGIPTGEKTGKVEPMIFYAIGMGLLKAEKNAMDWQLKLTPLGSVVLEEDPYLSEPVSLWIMHLMLCRPLVNAKDEEGIADPWFALFALGETRLGLEFGQEEFWLFLKERYGDNSYLKGMAGLILRSYEEDSCLGFTKALKSVKHSQGTLFSRNSAPQQAEFFPVYTTFLFLLWDEFFPTTKQISFVEFFRCSRLLEVLNWTRSEAQNWLNWIADHGVVQLDRQTGDILALRTSSTVDVLGNLYSELI